MARERLGGIREFCAEALAAHGAPSVSVAVVERGEVLLAEAAGLADTRSGRPATPATAYQLASVTKPFTATAVRRAAAQGLLDLDAPITAPPHASPAPNPAPAPALASASVSAPAPASSSVPVPCPAPTLRQLLSHQGGLAAYYDFHYLDEVAGPRPPRIDPAPYLVPVRAPGTAFEYANLGYLLAGRELERVTGRGLADVVREQVCAPLGLDSWHLGSAYPDSAHAAVGYTADGRAYPPYTVSHPGATLGWANAADVALFAYAQGELADPAEGVDLRGAGAVTGELGYGLGWCVSTGVGAGAARAGLAGPATGPRIVSHGGGGPGTAAFTACVPEAGLAVAVLCNSTDKSARDAVVERLLGELVPGFRAELISPVRRESAHSPHLPEGSVWTGTVTTPEGALPATLTVGPEAHVTCRVAGVQADATATATADHALRADLPLQLPTADARINSPRLGLVLRHGGAPAAPEDTLEGVAQAYKAGDREGRLGAFLSHRCALRRT